MGIWNRIAKVFKSNINAGLDKIEDPDKILEQSVWDLGEAISRLNSNLLNVTATRIGLEKTLETLKKQAIYWDSKCVQSDDPEATQDMEALNNRNRVLADIAKYQEQIRVQLEEEATTKKELAKAKTELTNLKNKKSLLSAKHNMAKAALQAEKLRDKCNPNGIYHDIERIEERIEKTSNEVKARRMLGEDETPDYSYAVLDYNSLMADIKAGK